MPDVTTIEIGGRSVRGFDDLEIHLGIDSHPTAGFYAPFEPERSEFRELFQPFSFADVEIRIDDALVFTGIAVDVRPSVESSSKTIAVSAYSRAALLDDCDPPVSVWPVEANSLTLRQIAERLASPFGVSVVLEGDEGAAFRRVTNRRRKSETHEALPDDRIGQFLADLARKRNKVTSSTREGDLLFRQSATPGSPVARFREGQPPVTQVETSFDPQSYYSEITGYTVARRGRIANRYTVRNQRLAGGPLRTLNFQLEDVEPADAPAAVRAKVGRMFGNMVSYVVHLPTWRDPAGNLFAENSTVTLEYPSAMVYRETELLVRDVILRRSANSQTASLGLVLPGAFSGDQPARLPWDE